MGWPKLSVDLSANSSIRRTAISRDMLASLCGSMAIDRKSTRLNSSHVKISYAVFCLKKKSAIGLGLVIVIVSGGYIALAGFGYRAYVIHTGAMFGTIMAANVWMRIWPLQKKIITAVRDGTPPDPAWGPLAAARSRHNTYLSVPLVWMMINSHTTVPFASSPIYLFVMIVVGWGAVYLLYQNTPRVKGF